MKVACEFNESIYGKKPEKTKIIVSCHNYQCTPSVEDLGNLVARIQATGADIVKIATTALDITDVARIFHITVHSQVSVLYALSIIPCLGKSWNISQCLVLGISKCRCFIESEG